MKDQIRPRKAPNTKLKIICHRIIGEVQRFVNRPVRNAQVVQSQRHQSAMQAGLCRGIIKLFRNRRAMLVPQSKSYHTTYVIHTSDVIKLYAPNPKSLRRGLYHGSGTPNTRSKNTLSSIPQLIESAATCKEATMHAKEPDKVFGYYLSYKKHRKY